MIPPQGTGHATGSQRSVLTVLVALCIGGGVVLASMPMAPLTYHMSAHILLMNLVAPALAMIAYVARRGELIRLVGKSLFPASAAQIGVLWIVHLPPVVAASMTSPAIHVLVQTTLLFVALWFWLAIVGQEGAARWRAILALLITGKLFCLLAALLVFAPRTLYSNLPTHGLHASAASDPLSDQHLAGLMMLVVCPLTYVLAGVLIAERWLSELRRQDAAVAPGISPVQ